MKDTRTAPPDEESYRFGPTCDVDVLCPDDIVRPCLRPAGHDGYHNGETDEEDT